MTNEYLYTTWLMRVLERVTLSGVIIIVSIILIIAFWKSLQKIDFDIKNEKNSARANIVFATPIFVLLILVAFSYITFSHPIIIKNKSEYNTPNDTEEKPDNIEGSTDNSDQFLSFYAGADRAFLDDLFYAVLNAERAIITYKASDKSNPLLLHEANSLLTTAKKDFIIKKYGADLVAKCRDEKMSEFNNDECIQIRGWLK